MLGSLILYLKGMRIMMFQLSGFYCKPALRTDSLNPIHTPMPLMPLPLARKPWTWTLHCKDCILTYAAYPDP